MVRIINIDTKTRTIRVSNADGDIKTWRTTESGTHFPIREGQTTKEGLQEFLKKHVVVGRVPDEPAKKDMGAEQLERLEKKGKGWGKEQMSVLRELGKTNPKGLKDELDRMETDEYKFGKPAKKDDYDRKFAHEINKGDIVSAGGKDYKIIQADRNWVIGLDDKGNRLRINPELSFDAFKVKKSAKGGSDKNADVSDIITDYKKKMKALGPGASIRKTDRVEADAIKEFMTRKLGANRPYDDYYNYWLNGMDKATKDAFNEIYNESEAREMAFSELASDVDHSGMARGEPTYDELEQWSEKQKAKKAQQQPAKRDIENIPISQLTPAERKILWDREQERYEATQKDIAKDTIKGLSGMVAKTEKLIESAKKTGTQEDVDDLTKYRDELKQSIKELSEIHGFSKKEPKPAEKKEAPKPAKQEPVEAISDEYMREINRLRKKAEKARKMGQGKTAMLLETRADSLAKEMFEKEDSEKNARWAEHEAEMDRASKEREKAAKDQEEADFQAWKKQQKPAKKERNWWRGPREDEDAYFDRREKTFEEARKIDKVSDWYKKAFAGDTEIPKNQSITFDELAKGMLSGKIKDFYETVGVDSSDIREKIFEELSERTGRPYDDFYDAWLHGGKK